MINIKKDAHVHTNFSPDADKLASFDEYIKRANEIGIKELIFTDHLDLDAAHPLFETPIDYDLYFKVYNQRKPNKNVKTRVGIEVGYQPHTIKKSMDIVKKYPFEYVILSVHYIDKMDLYTREYFQGKSKKEAYLKYFETCLEAINNTPIFDAFGHLDYIPRYSQLGDFKYDEFKDIIDKILKQLIERDKYLEINTSGYVSEKRHYPSNRIIDRYLELGGNKLIIGSDSHTVLELGRFFNKVNIEKEKQ